MNSSQTILPNKTSTTNLARLSYPRDILWGCIHCATCCGDVPGHERQILLLPSEAYCISREMNLDVQDFAESWAESEFYTLKMRKNNGRCVFLCGNRCAIYEIRPLVCHFYPVWLQQKDSVYNFGVTDSCPGLGNGKRLDRSYYISLLKLAQIRLGIC